jgi:iron complex transport system ATP-binding protein
MIELKDVSLGYNCRAVLEHISLKAAPGEILGLIGPNGSGKSTLIRGITRVIDLFSGHILVGGRSLKDIRREELARLVATVPQSAALPGAFTAFEVVLMGRTPHLGFLRYEGRKDLSIAWQAMEATQTEYLAERRVGELSGGERQRIVIARALAQQPKVILLDEPTTYLDINHQVETLDLVRKICLEQNLTVIVALHDLNLASQYCDRLVILDEGKIFAEGIPMEVLTSGNVKEVYGAEISILSHPINGLPVALVTASRG